METKEETKEVEEPKQEEPKQDKPLSMVESAANTAQDLKIQNDRLEKNIQELKELKALDLLGGKTDAGEQPATPKEETPAEYKARVEEEMKNPK